MAIKKISTIIFTLIMISCSTLASAQNNVPDPNKSMAVKRGGQGGGQGQHRGQKARIYKSVKVLEIYSKNGERVYSYGVSASAKGKDDKGVIDRVEKKNAGVKMIFGAGTAQEKIVEVLCSDCIVRVEYFKEDQE